MAYIDVYTAANDSIFQGRCQVAMWRAAQDIASEATDTPNYQSRRDWAVRVLQDKANITPRQLAMQVLRNAVIANAPTDSADGDLQYQVNVIVSDLIAIG